MLGEAMPRPGSVVIVARPARRDSPPTPCRIQPQNPDRPLSAPADPPESASPARDTGT